MATSLLAHDYWLEVDKSQISVGETNNIKLMFGENFSSYVEKPLQLDRTSEFRAYGLSRKSNNLLTNAEANALPVTKITPTKEGTVLVTMVRNSSVVMFGRIKFLEYASQEGNTNIGQALADDKIRVNDTYTRYLKTLFHVGSSANKMAIKKTGLEYEIVPLQDPFTPELKELSIKVLFQGRPAKGVKVSAIQRLDKNLTSASAITDQKGQCQFALNQKGAWMIRSVKIIPDAEITGPVANVHSYWASLTFGY